MLPTEPFFTKNNSNESWKSDFYNDFSGMRSSWDYPFNFGEKIQRWFIHKFNYKITMATFRTFRWNKDVRALKDAFENLNTRKGTSKEIFQVFCRKILKIMNLGQYLSSKLSARGVLDRYDLSGLACNLPRLWA